MRPTLLLCAIAALLGPVPATAAQDPELAAFVGESRQMIQAFARALKGELQAAVKQGGPPHAIAVCKLTAPQIARDISDRPGWTIGRTSHRLRNPENAPDAWEAAVLEDFLARAAAGQDVKGLERAEAVEADGRKAYRYMKAIPVQEVCLACHGAGLSAEVRARIEALYPEDKATGFAPGELRGAFTVTRSAADQ